MAIKIPQSVEDAGQKEWELANRHSYGGINPHAYMMGWRGCCSLMLTYKFIRDSVEKIVSESKSESQENPVETNPLESFDKVLKQSWTINEPESEDKRWKAKTLESYVKNLDRAELEKALLLSINTIFEIDAESARLEIENAKLKTS